ncbi:MAG: thiamine pyrophosphate-binding protein [Actinobacteria bacterium ATB1]|nr:thiamine pyrophosphate-binding protein [Actinobacteria bacterium ATB1]
MYEACMRNSEDEQRKLPGMDGGERIAEVLARAGVATVFCLQGEHIDPVLLGARDAGIRLVDTRREDAAAHMAEGWALVTGSTGVCAVTAGPGMTNAVTGLANAQVNGSPVLCLAGRRPEAKAGTWPLQDVDQVSVASPLTKVSRTVQIPGRLADHVSHALVAARVGRPGVAYLDFPYDVLIQESPPPAVDTLAFPRPPGPDKESLAQVSHLLDESARPVLVAGGGAHWAGAGEAIARLAEDAGVPVFTVNAGRGVVPDSHDWVIGPAVGVGGAFFPALTRADLVITVGTRLGWTFLHGAMFAGRTLVRVDVDAAETSTNLPGEVNISADAAVFAADLAGEIDGGRNRPRTTWRDELVALQRSTQDAFLAGIDRAANPIHPVGLIDAVVDAAGPEATLVVDGGDILTWGQLLLPAERPGSLLATSTYFGCMGVGIPYGIAAKLARPDAPVVVVEGDGSFGFHAMEFDTALRHDVPFVCVVANNGAWGMSKHIQGLMGGYDRLAATELGVRPYHEMVRGLGGYGEMVEDPGDLRPAIGRAIESGLPSCVNVVTDPDAYSPMTAVMAQPGFL